MIFYHAGNPPVGSGRDLTLRADWDLTLRDGLWKQIQLIASQNFAVKFFVNQQLIKYTCLEKVTNSKKGWGSVHFSSNQIHFPNFILNQDRFMRQHFFFFSFFLLICSLTSAQNQLKDFRAFEKRVCHKYPDSLQILSLQADSNSTMGRIYKSVHLGKYYYWKSRYDEAYLELSKAYAESEKTGHLILQAEISLDISKCLSMLENTGSAMEFLLFSKDIFDQFGDESQKGRVRISLGELYRKVGDYDKANQILDEGFLYYSNDFSLLASYYNRKAAIKSELGQIDSSLYFSNLALDAAYQSPDKTLIAVSENEIGYMLRHKQEQDSALVHFQKADSIFSVHGMLPYALQAKYHEAIIYSLKKDHKKGLQMFMEGYRIAHENKWYRIEKDYAEQLRNTYYWLGKNDSGFYFNAEMYRAGNDLLSNQYQMSVRMVESMFAKDKFEKQINQQEQQISLERERNESVEKTNRFMFAVIVLTLLVLILLLYIVYLQIKRKKISQARAFEKEKQNIELKHLLKNNEALVQEISHRVKNNLGVLSGLLGIQKSRALNEEVKKELQDAILRVDSIASIHNQLYDTKENAHVNLKKTLEDLAENISRAMGKDFYSEVRLNLAEISLDISRSVSLNMIVNELITNSFKYGVKSPGDYVEIVAILENGNVVVTVSDKGAGYDISTNTGEKNTMGLYLIDMLCRQLKATKTIKQENGFFKTIIEIQL